jgi:hypothetical protein
MQRRSLLKLGVASAVLLAAAGGTLALLKPGLVDGRLSGAGREVFHATARAILEGILPSDPVAQQRALSGLLDRVDALVAGLPAHVQEELSQLLAVMASAPGRWSLAGLKTSWPAATPLQVNEALHDMRFSSLALRQQAYHALHDIVNGSYFSEPSTWPFLGYPGPQEV